MRIVSVVWQMQKSNQLIFLYFWIDVFRRLCLSLFHSLCFTVYRNVCTIEYFGIYVEQDCWTKYHRSGIFQRVLLCNYVWCVSCCVDSSRIVFDTNNWISHWFTTFYLNIQCKTACFPFAFVFAFYQFSAKSFVYCVCTPKWTYYTYVDRGKKDDKI